MVAADLARFPLVANRALHILKQDAIDLTDASPGTTIKALKAAVANGTITEMGGNPKKSAPKKRRFTRQRRQRRRCWS